MGRTNLLSCLEKREMLNQTAASVDKLLKWAVLYEQEGMLNDAVDFYERANASESLEKLLNVAREEGDTFLCGRILRALNREIPSQEWISLGERARELGKHAYAREALRRGGIDVAATETAAAKEDPAS